MQGTACFRPSGILAATLAAHAAAQGAGNDEDRLEGWGPRQSFSGGGEQSRSGPHLGPLHLLSSCISACRMEPVDVALQVRDLSHLVTFRAADEPMSGHVLNSSKIMLSEPVGDHTCPHLLHVLEPAVLLS